MNIPHRFNAVKFCPGGHGYLAQSRARIFVQFTIFTNDFSYGILYTEIEKGTKSNVHDYS